MKLRTAVTLFLDLRMKAHTLVPLAIALTGLASVLHAQDTTAAAPDTGYAEYHESPIALPLGGGLQPGPHPQVGRTALPDVRGLRAGGKWIDLPDATQAR